MTRTNSLTSDPVFANAGSGDFSLQSTSPCIDVGTDVSLTTDYAGATVPYGTGVDIGAYEWRGGSADGCTILGGTLQ